MDSTTLHDNTVLNIIDKSFVPVMLDIDTDSIATKYKALELPTIILLDGDQKVLKELHGYIEPHKMSEILIATVKDNEHLNPNVTPQSTVKQTDAFLLNEKFYSNLNDELLQQYKDEIEKASTTKTSIQNFDLDKFEYAVKLTLAGNQIAREWIKVKLDIQLALLDPVWGGVYAGREGSRIDYQKLLLDQANARYVSHYSRTK